MADRYPVPAETRRVEEVVKGSRFIATIARASTVADAEAFIHTIRTEFADATHNCWAYQVGPPGSTAAIGMSDDGEPHGTAGRPMLGILLHSGVGDVAVVVTRYFGGTKLGTGGLVRAYSGAVQQALNGLALTERIESAEVRLVVDYSSIDRVQQLVEAHEARVVAEDYAADVTYTVRLPVERVDAFRAAVMDATRGQARVEAPEG